MKVKELIAKLQEIECKEVEVTIPIYIKVNDTIINTNLNILDVGNPSALGYSPYSVTLIAR